MKKNIYTAREIDTESQSCLGKERKQRRAPLSVVISLLLIYSIVCTLFVFASCEMSKGGLGQQVQQPPQIVISDELDLPDYVRDLLTMDEIFKYYSYDGVDEEEMKTNLLKAYIAATGDVYAEYMTAEEYEAYMSESTGEFVGIGVSIVETTISIGGYTYKVMEVISVFKDSPALESGVRVGDCIVYVGGGEERTLVDTIGYTKALDIMLGEAGTVAEFTVFRPDGKTGDYTEINFAIERRKVETESVYYRVSESDDKVGIVNITGFDLTTPTQFTDAVDTLLEQGCEHFVFDMRNNPGGSLDSIETVLAYFLNEGDLIVSTEYSDGSTQYDYVKVKKYTDKYSGFDVTRSDIGKYKDLDCIVLVNENTASAAELFTATLRDYGIAKVVGITTYGKGCMQTILPLDYYGLEGGLRVTVAMYFSKSHHVYHEIGIIPDEGLEVQLSEEALEYNFFLLPEAKDDQLKTAIAELLK